MRPAGDSLLGAAIEVLLPALRREPIGCRVRIKPSWSGRVYGTYGINGRVLFYALAFVASTAALFHHLLALNLAEPGLGRERQELVASVAYRDAVRVVRRPATLATMTGQSERLYASAHQLETVLGLHLPGEPRLGLGRLDAFAEVSEPALEAGDPLGRLVSEARSLGLRFGLLDGELLVRGESLRYLPSIVPLFETDFVPTSPFGRRISPFTQLPEIHRGQDLAADTHTKVVAAADGVVAAAESDSNSHMGRYVVIDHDGRYRTYYGHCERLFVAVGDKVVRHQIIAEVGSTGRSTGPHLHYEVRVNGEPNDPRHFMVFDPHFQGEEHFRFD